MTQCMLAADDHFIAILDLLTSMCVFATAGCLHMQVRFLTKIYHVGIDKVGRLAYMCCERCSWNPFSRIRTVLHV